MPDRKHPTDAQKDIADLFGAYLTGELSTEKNRRLEAELKDDNFNAEWQSLLDLNNALPNLGRDILDEPIPGRLLRVIVQLKLKQSEH